MGEKKRQKKFSQKKNNPEPPLVSSRSLLTSLQPYHKQMEYKVRFRATKSPERMAAAVPVEVGTRGTVGSLVMREIEYFSRIELDRHGSGSSQRSQAHVVDVASGSTGRSRRRFWFLIMTWRRKKRSSSSSTTTTTFLPSICSVVEVADSHRLNGIPGFNYRILKDDLENMQF